MGGDGASASGAAAAAAGVLRVVPAHGIPGGSAAQDGAARGTSCVAKGTYRGVDYLAYLNGRNVVVLDAHFQLVQTLDEHDTAVLNVGWNHGGGQIATLSAHGIFTYEAVVEASNKVRWVRKHTLRSEKRMSCVSWHASGQYLLAGGAEIALYALPGAFATDATDADGADSVSPVPTGSTVTPYWRTKSATHVVECALSPDGRLFATRGEYDCLLKVWHQREGATGAYTNVYLRHPQSVCNIAWRESPTGYARNVLTTTCRDGVVRLWSETDHTEEFHMYICVALDATQVRPGAHVAWLAEHCALDSAEEASITTSVAGETASGKLAAPPTGHTLVGPTTRTTTPLEVQPNRMTATTALAANEQADWLLCVEPDGTVLVWLVTGLSSQPRRTPFATLFTKLFEGIANVPDMNTPTDGGHDGTPTANGADASGGGGGGAALVRSVVMSKLVFVDRDARNPSMVMLTVEEDSGVLSRYERRLDALQESDRLALVERFAGHTAPVQQLQSPISGDLMASIDADHTLRMWHLDRARCTGTTPTLQYMHTLYGAHACVWSKDDEALYVCTNRCIEVFACSIPHGFAADLQVPRHVSNIAGSSNRVVSHLCVVQATATRAYLLGVAQSGLAVYVWSVHTDGGRHTSRFVLEHTLDDAQRITSASSAAHLKVADHVHEPYNLMTGGADGVVRLWRLETGDTNDDNDNDNDNDNDDDVALEQVGELHAHDGAVVACALSSYDTIATGCLSPPQVRIWEAESHVPQLRLEAELPGHAHAGAEDDMHIALSWLPLNEVGDVLALSYGRAVSLFVQHTTLDGFHSDSAMWGQVASVDRLFASTVRSLRWLANGMLVIGCTNEIEVCTQWAAAGDQSLHNLFSYAARSAYSLPDYHPQVLQEYLMANHFGIVASIVEHLEHGLKLRSEELPLVITRVPLSVTASNADDGGAAPAASASRASAAPAAAAAASSLEPDFSSGIFASGFGGAPAPRKDLSKYDALFGPPSTTYDDLLNSSSLSSHAATSSSSSSSSGGAGKGVDVDTAAAKRVSEMLSQVSLPGVNRIEQVRLLAVLDTFVQVQQHKSTLDACGVRYFIAFKMFSFLRRTAPMPQRPKSLQHVDMAWALQSENDDALLRMCLPDATPDWPRVRSLGLGYWLKTPSALKQVMDKVARAHFLHAKAAGPGGKGGDEYVLFYLALQKKQMLVGLLKAIKETKLYTFVANDFSVERWKTAALKNAYVLLGKHRFIMAAAFFLLAGDLSDAVNVCANSLGDLQLALTLCRLVEGERGPLFMKTVQGALLTRAREERDPWLASIGLWWSKEYEAALKAVVDVTLFTNSRDFQPSVTHYVFHLQNKPFVQQVDADFEHTVSLAAYAYSHAGCDLLALDGWKQLIDRVTDNRTQALFYPILMYRIAVRYVMRQLRDIVDSGRPWLDEAADVKAGIQLLETEYHVDKRALLDTLGNICERSGYVCELYVLHAMHDDHMAVVELLRSTSLKVLSVASSLTRGLVTPTHAIWTARLALYLHRCVQHYMDVVGQPVSVDTRMNVTVALYAAVFVAAWTVRDYDGLLVVLNNPLSTLGNRGEGAWWCFNQTFMERLRELAHRQAGMEGTNVPGVRQSLTATLVLRVYLRHLQAYVAYGEQVPRQFLPLMKSLLRLYMTTEKTLCVLSNPAVEWMHQPPLFTVLLSRAPHFLIDVATRVRMADVEGNGGGEGSDDDDGHPAGVVDLGTSATVDFATRMSEQAERLLQFAAEEFDEELEQDKALASAGGSALPSGAHTPLSAAADDKDGEAGPLSVAAAAVAAIEATTGLTVNTARASAGAGTPGAVTPQTATPSSMAGGSPQVDGGSPAAGGAAAGKGPVTAVELYKTANAMLRSLCLNRAAEPQPQLVAVATPSGIREFYVDHSLRFRKRSPDHTTLLDDEQSTWRETLSRFSKGPMLSSPADASSPSQYTKLPVSHVWQGNAYQRSGKHLGILEQRISRDAQTNCYELAGHPSQPFYLSGNGDGVVHLWEYSKEFAVAEYRCPQKAKPTRLRWNTHGNKFGATTEAGELVLWNFGGYAESLTPFEVLSCHKRAHDFAFLNSGSYIATVGPTSEDEDLVLWDVLMPPARARIAGVSCVDGDAVCVEFSARHQVIVVAGKRGDVAVVDVRQRRVLHTIRSAHDTSIRATTLLAGESVLVTGGSDGEVKLWDLGAQGVRARRPLAEYKRTHVKSNLFRKGIAGGSGVNAMVSDGRNLFSCGADGRLVRTTLALRW